MKETSCCFSGNREIPKGKGYLELCEQVNAVAEDLIRKGYTDFYCGGALGFDSVCALEIIKLREKFPFVRLIIVIPFKGQSDRWLPSQKLRYEVILKNADERVTVCNEPSNYAFMVRNRYMVDRCSSLVYYQRKDSGGTKNTVEYAKKQGLDMIPI